MGLDSIVAVVFDFDDTLVPDSTTMLLKQHGIDPIIFWQQDLKALVTNGYDPTLGFLRLLLDNIGPGRPLGLLTNANLATFGASLDPHFHPGLPQLFDDLRGIGSQFDIALEFYIVSGGLRAVIEGSQIVKDHFTAAYGCELAESGSPPRLDHVKRTINFTEKTRYLFEINKGLSSRKTYKNPYLVNKDVPKSKRRIPFRNMVYVGDGLTDIPCFSMLDRLGGTCFGVFDPADEAKAKRALLEFLKPKRVISMHAPRYSKNDELGSFLRAAVSNLCSRLDLASETAERGPDDDD